MATRIGYFIPEFPGQTHIFFWRELRALRELGAEPDVVSTRFPDRSIVSHTWADEARQATTYLFPPSPAALGSAFWTLLRAGPKAWWRCFKTFFQAEGNMKVRFSMFLFVLVGAQLGSIARRKGWSHLHVHSCGNAALIAYFANVLTGLPYSITLHGPLKDYGLNQKLKWAHAAFALIITKKLRKEAEEKLGASMPARIEQAPMGVDVERFQRGAAYEPWDGRGPFRLFACGRLNPCKGHDDLMRAIAELRQQGVLAELRIAGADDTEWNYRGVVLEKLQSELKLNEQVQFMGAVSEDVVQKGLREAHAFVLGSWAEPLGVAIMEAMALNVPVVVTGAGGVPELVDDGIDGLLVPPQEPLRMAESLIRLGKDPGLARRLSEAGRRKIEKSFHSRRSAEVLLQCIQDGKPFGNGAP